ncbi:MAG: hypothetical protein ACW99U_07345 [Candidatus Thorarchaeota archaeon]
MPSNTAALQDHNLEWGVQEGQTLTYVLQRRVISENSIGFVSSIFPFIDQIEAGQKILANVSHLDPIPEEIEGSSDIPTSSCDLLRENDSTVLQEDTQLYVVPIGNWELLSGFFDLPMGGVLVNNEESWGATVTGSFTVNNQDVTYFQEIIYEKENGTLSRIRLRYTSLGVDLADIVLVLWYPGVPTLLAPELQLTTVLLAGITIGVMAVAVFTTFRWYKGRKSLLQKLGE